MLTTLVALIAVIALAEQTAWKQIRRLREDLRPALAGDFHSADHVRSAILEAHEAWSASAGRLGKGEVTSFQSAAERAEMSLRQELAAAAAPGDADVLTELTRAQANRGTTFSILLPRTDL